MTKNPRKRRKGWTVLINAMMSLALLVLAMNFVTPEKTIERRIEHRFSIADPQFRREMSVMLGPSVISGNDVTALHNGVEILPTTLDAIRGARVSAQASRLTS
ncbi:MAG TPA: hypothetical protein VK855_01400 [Thioalkalivibrio sp.]|nr:hypothetical protein [Thioalkalivibrio sp.]